MLFDDLIKEVGIDSTVAIRNRELRAYQAAQLPAMKEAGRAVQKAESDLLHGGTIIGVGEGRTRTHRTKSGKLVTKTRHLYQLVRLRVSRTFNDVQARIDYSPRGFYGRFHEEGTVHEKARPTFPTTVQRTEGQVETILGNTYGAFSS